MIGVFDSGLGGLTILQGIVDVLADEYVYLSDQARTPYGTRSDEDVYVYTHECVEWLRKQGCSIVILACNTASAVALRRLQALYASVDPAFRVLGIIVPTIETVTGAPWHDERVSEQEVALLVFATPATVRSHVYAKELSKRTAHASVVEQACPTLVYLIESGVSQAAARVAVQGYVDEALQRCHAYKHIGTWSVVLGCTHYELLREMFVECLPPQMRVLSQPTLVAEALMDYVSRHCVAVSGVTTIRCFTTGDADRVSLLAQRFLTQGMGDASLRFTHVSCADR